MAEKKIITVYNRRETPDRDDTVLERINHWISKEIATLADGLIRTTPVISAQSRDFIGSCYGITESDWTEIKRSKEFAKMSKLASPLKLGLIISYCKRRHDMYLNYCMILIYSSLLTKYFKQGYNRDIMKYTIDTADGRTDFKKYDGSLLMVVQKKVETFTQLFGRRFKDEPDDKLIREILQSVSTRINETVKTISKKYYANFHDPDVKIMLQYSKMDDGKNVISPLGVMEAIREMAVNNLAYPSDKVLTMIGLTSNNVPKLRYRVAILDNMSDNFGLMSSATSIIIDEWMKRNQDNISLKMFRSNFVKTMSVARNMNAVNSKIDAMVEKIIENRAPNAVPLNRIDMRKYIYLYLLANIYVASTNIIK